MKLTLNMPNKLSKNDDFVVLRRNEYERLLKNFFEAKDALSKIRQAEKEFKNGKTRVIQSLADLRH